MHQAATLILCLVTTAIFAKSPSLKDPPGLLLQNSAFGYPATLSASSHLKQQGTQHYTVSNLIDDDPRTAWFEGAKGMGVGQTLSVTFDNPVLIYGIKFIPGYAKSSKVMMANAIPDFRLKVGVEEFDVGRVILEHHFHWIKSGPFAGDPVRVPTPRPENLGMRYLLLPKPISAKTLSVELAGALAEAGVDPDNGFSEWWIITDRILARDEVAKFLLKIRNGDLTKTLANSPVDFSVRDDACGQAAKKARKALGELTSTKVEKEIRQSLSGTRLRDGKTMLAPVFTIQQNNSHILTFDRSLNDSCYSDGEGGTHFLPRLTVRKKSVSIEATPRSWPVP